MSGVDRYVGADYKDPKVNKENMVYTMEFHLFIKNEINIIGMEMYWTGDHVKQDKPCSHR